MNIDRGQIFLKNFYFGYVTDRDFWKQNPDEKMLLLDGNLAKKILSNLNNATEQLSKENKAIFLIVAPQIRRHVSQFIRAQLSAVNVLSFTELPEDRNVEIAFTIGDTEEKSEDE